MLTGRLPTGRGPVTFACTEVADGDFAVGADPTALERARRRIRPGPWTWLRQVHGADVVVVDGPGVGAGAEADAAVTSAPGAVLAVQTADCVPVVLAAAGGALGVVHAGWRGARAGVVAAAVEALAGLAPGPVAARIGPHIRAAHYAFGPDDLDDMSERFGAEVAVTTADGHPALDMTRVITVALERAGVDDVRDLGGCTSDAGRWYSHRLRGDVARQATVAWLAEPGDGSAQ